MLKTIKYELRKNMNSILLFLGIYALLEVVMIAGVNMHKDSWVGISLSLLFGVGFASSLFVMTAQVMGYSRELKDKSGYLVFMTPLSSRRILGAKLLTTLVCATILGVFGFGLMLLDYGMVEEVFELEAIPTLLDMVLSQYHTSVRELLLTGLSWVGMLYLSCIFFVCLCFFSISLSATLLQDKKGKGVISVVIFLVLFLAYTWISNHLPVIGKPVLEGMYDTLEFGPGFFLNNIISILFQVVCSIACWLGSAWLLDNKISL